jgi:hypothetical protein
MTYQDNCTLPNEILEQISDCSKIGELPPSTAKVGEKRHFARKFFSNPFSAA